MLSGKQAAFLASLRVGRLATADGAQSARRSGVLRDRGCHAPHTIDEKPKQASARR
jgi:hypothetical protein